MSNIFIQKQKSNIEYANPKSYKVKKLNKMNKLGHLRFFPPANTEWYDSIYAYNKSSTKLLPVYNNMVTSLIASYFSLYDPKKEKNWKQKLTRRMRIRLKRLSLQRAFISRVGLKHSSSNIVVSSSIFNTQQLYAEKKWQLLKSFDSDYNNLLNDKLSIYTSYLDDLKVRLLDERWKLKSKKHLKVKEFKKLKNISRDIYTIRKKIAFSITRLKPLNYSVLDLKKMSIIRVMLNNVKNTLIFHLRRNINTQSLNTIIKKLYGKDITLNFRKLNYINSNSDIIANSISVKLKDRKKKALKIIRSSFKSLIFSPSNKFNYYGPKTTSRSSWFYNKINNLSLNSIFNKFVYSSGKDVFNKLLKKAYLNNNGNTYGKYNVFNNIEHKEVNGIKIDITGRITKRLTAQRSVHKSVHKGSLKNIDSSYKGLSTVMLRGHHKCNLQYTKKSSKNRNGSFGLKISINGI